MVSSYDNSIARLATFTHRALAWNHFWTYCGMATPANTYHFVVTATLAADGEAVTCLECMAANKPRGWT